MYNKTRYKKFRGGGAVLSDTETPPAPPVAIVDIDKNDSPGDDASVHFQKQIAALRTAEDRQRTLEAEPPKLSRAETIRQWKQAGLSEKQAEFLNQNPELVDIPHMLEASTTYARHAGHAEDSTEFFDAIKSHFHKHMTLPEAAAEADKPTSDRTPEPKFDPPSRSNASMYSAPVSREGYTSALGASNGDRPGTVRLSVAQLEHAKAAGVSPKEYAEGVLRLRAEKADGYHQ
jgi:hypothetical protein